MLKLILISILVVSYGILVVSAEKEDLNEFEEWDLEDNSDKETSAAEVTSETPDVPKEPVSHIQKIPRRGEKTTAAPLAALERKRRDTEKEVGSTTKERKRGHKNRQKDLVESPADGQDANREVDSPPNPSNGKPKKTRKPKSSRKPKITNADDGSQPRKERKNKKDKTRKPKEGKNRQDRSRPTKVRKGQNTPKTDTASE